jgi:hypothetical protein
MIYDFVVIGSGPVGSILAWLLSKRNKICLIDIAGSSKKIEFTPFIQETTNKYEPVNSNKLGGNSELWHNKVFLMTRREFEYGKWQFTYNELVKNSNQLAKKLKIKKFKKERTVGKFEVSRSERVNLNNVYEYLNINKIKNIKVIKHSSPVYLDFDEKLKKVCSIIIKNKDQKIDRIFIKKSIIFSAGGLGNIYLLMNLLSQNIKKIPLISLKDHPHVIFGRFSKNKIMSFLPFSKYFVLKKNYEDNIIITIKKKKLKYFSMIQLTKNSAYDILRNIIYLKSKKNFFLIFTNIIYFFYKRIKYYLLNIQNENFAFEFAFSQNTNKSSIKLSNKKDEYGLKKIKINWKIPKSDLKIYYFIIKEFFKKNKIKIDEKKLYAELTQKIWSGQHPSCTTPISRSKSKFCVDRNLKLNGMNNLYLCGSSVFPINGFTNPTWTAMSLAQRLTNHINDQ